MASVLESIKQPIMFTNNAEVIWKNLETRFSTSIEPRKYQLCRSMYEIKQHTKKVSDYYTELKCKWKEYAALRDLPGLTMINNKMKNYLVAIHKEQEE
ncbi:Homeobox-leucine zipper protein HOX6 [Bienertia sinuspersici]